MKTVFKLFVGIIITILLGSCSSKKVAYFQDIEKQKDLTIYHNYEPKIKKDDKLNIVVSAPDKDVVTPYNNDRMAYLVDANGYINFPVLGKIEAEGLTVRELSDKLTAEISKDVKNPIVNASFTNYKITVLGEVRTPGTFTMTSEKTTLLQALGMAGDLSLGAKRSDILLIREIDGKYKHIRIDLRKSDIFSSPYYYLCQNDVIYVTPTSSRTFSGSSQATLIPIVTSSIGLVISIVALVLSNN
ncbi:polysaccharide biosynthesis/export family protein [Prevotella sp. 10(H)]|uniref:polysaccharide biosynthesis/export family protein n=1 Tax=Prevotella sp. 10(H) TaxID=1158294 RepID=UPI0004A6F708|nr:polysaccharide biosynthesis/export family protein [Prevotella sp. 10(H)]